MIIFIYWLACLTLGISNSDHPRVMHLASFQGDMWEEHRHEGMKAECILYFL